MKSLRSRASLRRAPVPVRFPAVFLGIWMSTFGLAACSAEGGEPGNDDDEMMSSEPELEQYLEGVPELEAFEMTLTGDEEAEGLATDTDAIAAVMAADSLGSVSSALQQADVPEALQKSRRAIQDLNQGLRNFLLPIAAMVRNTAPDEVEANVAMWGPVVRGVTEYRFFLKKGPRRHYGWLLQARPEEGSDAYSNVAAGEIAVGSVVRRGRGKVGIDLDLLGEVDPTVHARGKVLAGFAHGPRGTVLAYGLKEFTADSDDATPVSALIQGVHLDTGFNRVRLAFYGNLSETDSEMEELLLARVRHHRRAGGRSDVLVTGGDVPAGTIWVVSECWNEELESVFRIVRECPGDGIGGARCEVRSSRGEALACLEGLQTPELPPLDPEEHMEDPESPDADLLPPEEFPSGEAPAEE